MAEFFIDSAGKTSGSYICGGEYVTVLARRLNVLTPDIVDTLTVATVGSYVNISTLLSMGLVRRTPEGARLVGRDGVIWDPLPGGNAEEEEEGVHVDIQGGQELQFGDMEHGGGAGRGYGRGEAEFQGGHGFEHGGFGHGGFGAPPEPDLPSYGDFYRQFQGLRTTVDDMRTTVDDVRTTVEDMRVEQRRQGEVLDTMREESHRAYQWLFGAHTAHERYYHDYEPPLQPPPRFPFDCPGSRKAPRGGGGESSSRGAGHMDED